jgi:class 3 adenylate cyclase
MNGTSDYMVAFSGQTQSYCIGVVDMINSTKISAHLNSEKISTYYEIFLNSMSKTLSSFGGIVIKNIGDSLFYYFPESANKNNFEFTGCLESCLAMIKNHKSICDKLESEKLPPVNYRISADYGSVILMTTNHSTLCDMIGPSVNICTKINRIASPNGVVIGGDLYHMTKNFKEYSFKEKGEMPIGLKQTYPVYTFSRKNGC